MIKGVTILTGFLGAGNTTLLNAIITTHNDIRYTIIENEFGQESIDSELVVASVGGYYNSNQGM